MLLAELTSRWSHVAGGRHRSGEEESIVPVPCARNIPESRRGAGECDIQFDMLKRSGKPNWWCSTHGMEASHPDGTALAACPAAWLEPVPPALRLQVDLAAGEYAVWGVVPAAIEVGSPPVEPGSVHVHHRPGRSQGKDIDQSFDIVTVTNGPNQMTIDGMAAQAFSLSELSGQPLKLLHVRAAARRTSTSAGLRPGRTGATSATAVATRSTIRPVRRSQTPWPTPTPPLACQHRHRRRQFSEQSTFSLPTTPPWPCGRQTQPLSRR